MAQQRTMPFGVIILTKITPTLNHSLTAASERASERRGALYPTNHARRSPRLASPLNSTEAYSPADMIHMYTHFCYRVSECSAEQSYRNSHSNLWVNVHKACNVYVVSFEISLPQHKRSSSR